jgi:hypothetical protein
MTHKLRIKVAGGTLPYARYAQIDSNKFTEYALNPAKSDKARGFRVKLGFELGDWRDLHDQIIERVPESELISIRTDTRTKWPEWEVEIPIDGRQGKRCPISTGWMVDERHEPWLTTLHVIHERTV